MKCCLGCAKLQPLGKPNWCQRCSRIKAKAKTYGVSFQEIMDLYSRNNGTCDICKTKDEDLFIDHDHTTGEIRGLLCVCCNGGLGMFRDNIRIIAEALVYLEKHGKEF